MPYNDAIPGQITKFQMQSIELVATLVPQNGRVVEVGSLFGSSSWCWAKSVHPSVTVHCVDPWENNVGVASIEERLGIKYGVEQFRAYTKDCPNIRAEQGYSPRDFQGWSDDIDLYYEDAVHTNPILSRNLDFWTAHLKPTGIACGDDFRPRFPDVRNGATRLARRLGRSLITVENFWCILPPDGALGGVEDVRRGLEELSSRYLAEQRTRGPHVACRSSVAGEQAGQAGAESAIVLDLHVEPRGLHRWPADPGDTPLELVYSIAEASNPDVPIGWGDSQTPVDQIRPDIVEKFSVTIEGVPENSGVFVVDMALRDPRRPTEAKIPLSRINVRQAA